MATPTAAARAQARKPSSPRGPGGWRVRVCRICAPLLPVLALAPPPVDTARPGPALAPPAAPALLCGQFSCYAADASHLPRVLRIPWWSQAPGHVLTRASPGFEEQPNSQSPLGCLDPSPQPLLAWTAGPGWREALNYFGLQSGMATGHWFSRCQPWGMAEDSPMHRTERPPSRLAGWELGCAQPEVPCPAAPSCRPVSASGEA